MLIRVDDHMKALKVQLIATLVGLVVGTWLALETPCLGKQTVLTQLLRLPWALRLHQLELKLLRQLLQEK
jgi:hypothetical protein